MKKLIMSCCLGLALAAFNVGAVPISGNITFGGTANVDTGSAGTANAVTAWHGFGGVGNPIVSDADGDFSGIAPLTSVSIAAPWSFSSGPVNNFWVVGGFTFDLVSSAVTARTTASVSVTGHGLVSAAGYDDTYGTWEFTTQDPSAGTPARFTFSAASAVPDGGTTMILLGGAMTLLGLIRRKMA